MKPDAPKTAFYTHIDTPDGVFSVIVADGAVIASGWTSDLDDLVSKIHPSLRPTRLQESAAETKFAAEAVHDYYAGDITAIDSVPVKQVAAEFRSHAWKVLRTVPPGDIVTYSDFAELAERPLAVRAAASACAQNAVALFVPCHRIRPKSGGVGNFYYDTAIKENLLRREAQHPQ